MRGGMENGDTMKTITGGALLLIITTLTIIGTINITKDDNVYYCEERDIVMQCDRLSESTKTCYGETTKRCLSGWTMVINEEETSQTGPRQYLCSVQECVDI